MRTKQFFFLISLGLFLFNACVVENTTTPPPVADFMASSQTVYVGESVSFTDMSKNSPTEWNWKFEGGSPDFSVRQNPVVTYDTPGKYDVSLSVSSDAGSDSKVRYSYINVIQPDLSLTLYNYVYTDLTVTIGNVTRVIPPDGSFVFTGFMPNSNITISAYTSGYKQDNSTIGNILTWNDIPVTIGTSNEEIGLSTASGIFFLYIQNLGGELHDLYVNKESTDETYDDIIIPGDGLIYGIGYYNEYSNGNVYAFFNDGSGESVYWIHNTEYTFTGEENESILLINDKFKKKKSSVVGTVPTPKSVSTNLIPVTTTKKSSSLPVGITLYPNNGMK